MKRKKNVWHVILDTFCILLATLAGAVIIACLYISTQIRMNFEGLIYTFTSPLGGTGIEMVTTVAKYCVPLVIIGLALVVTAFWLKMHYLGHEPKPSKHKITFRKVFVVIYYVICAGMILTAAVYAYTSLDMRQYFLRYNSVTTLYEEQCVQPEASIIHAENPNNLICIYLESMETKYQFDDGTPCDCIPKLTSLAMANDSFGKTEQVAGGIKATTGATWTIGALLTTTSGIPYAMPVSDNYMMAFRDFMPKLTSMGDILNSYGYEQEFLMACESSFAGNDKYLMQHGNYTVLDCDDAIERGYADEYVWWGIDDKTLYAMARDEITRLYETGKPFNLSLATMDTHNIGGYVCEICPDTYDDHTANVLSCADNQLQAFVDWIRAQPFAENTTIVIMGDHPRLDNCMVNGIVDREAYNCILNSRVEPAQSDAGRQVGAFDMFPTMLAAMGFTIDGERLGLGTNLYSDRQTLYEEFGYTYINEELSRHSKYYEDMYY